MCRYDNNIQTWRYVSMTWQHDKALLASKLQHIFIEQIVSIFKFVFKFVNMLCPKYTRDFKIKIFLAVFYNFKAASSKGVSWRSDSRQSLRLTVVT